MDRRRGSPPPPPQRRGSGRYDGPDRMPMRHRSRSPPDYGRSGRGRSPPRRRDDDYPGRYDRFPPDNYRGGPPGRGGRPFPDGYPDRGGSRSPDRYEGAGSERGPSGPMTFKQYITRLPDDLSPEEAQERYRQYLVEHHGSVIKAEFATTKDQTKVKALYDPRSFEKALAKRNEEAAESRSKFFDDLNAGALEPTAAGFNQGAGSLAPKATSENGTAGASGDASTAKEDQSGTFAPAFCWQPSRVSADLKLARRLARRLDFEKAFEGDNPLLPAKSEEATAAQAAADAQAAQDAAQAQEEGKAEGSAAPRQFIEVEDPPETLTQDTYTDVVNKLDLLLTYLWRVHGVDYYTGYELTAQEYPQRLTACRLLRGPKPDGVEKNAAAAPAGATDANGDTDMTAAATATTADDSNQNNAAAGTATAPTEGASADGASGANGVSRSGTGGVLTKEEQEAAAGVEACWTKRIADGDPLEAQCQRQRVEEELEKWIDSQIIRHADEKWGNTLSTKQFRARKFVVKHIRTKHEEKLQVQRDKIYDELYWENFKAAKQAEEDAKQQEHAQEGGEGGHHMDVDHHEGGFAAPRGGMAGRGGRGGRMGPGGRGPGRRMMPGMVPPAMMMDPMALMAGMAGMPPMLPFMPMMAAAAGMGMGMPLMPPAMLMGAMAGRGGPGGRMGGGRGPASGGGGGRGRGGGRGGVSLRMDSGREYFDLDNPQNNRAVLDYGDL